MNPSILRRAALAALLAAPFAASAASAEFNDGAANDLVTAIHRAKAKAAADQAAPAPPASVPAAAAKAAAAPDDPMAAFAAQLAAKYKVTLTRLTVRCPCYSYSATGKDGKDLGQIKGEMMGRTPEQTQAELENDLRGRIGLPQLPKPAGPAVKSSALEIMISVDAQSQMTARGVSLQGNVLRTRTQDVNLNADGQTQSVAIRTDPNNVEVLIVTATNKDGSKDTVRIVGGRVAP
jgi:hypothetical protein